MSQAPATPPARPTSVDAALQDAWLSLDELCQLAGLSPEWVQAHVSGGLLLEVSVTLQTQTQAPEAWRFDAGALRRACRLAALERDFNALPELAALVADLEDEVARLRQRLGR